jgi:hypothetical protein
MDMLNYDGKMVRRATDKHGFDRVVFISGVSGAGKDTAARLILNHIAPSVRRDGIIAQIEHFSRPLEEIAHILALGHYAKQ